MKRIPLQSVLPLSWILTGLVLCLATSNADESTTSPFIVDVYSMRQGFGALRVGKAFQLDAFGSGDRWGRLRETAGGCLVCQHRLVRQVKSFIAAWQPAAFCS